MSDYENDTLTVKIRYGSVVNNIGGFNESYYHEGKRPDLECAFRTIKRKIEKQKSRGKIAFPIIIYLCDDAWNPLKELIENAGLSEYVEFHMQNEIYTSELSFKTVSSMIKGWERNLKRSNNNFERLLFRGQSNEGWNISSGLYRYIQNSPNAQNIMRNNKLTPEVFQKIVFYLDDQFAPNKYEDVHELFTSFDFQHLRALTEYVDLTEDYMVAFKFANLEHQKDVLSRVFIFAEVRNEKGTHDIWAVKRVDDKLIFDKKYGQGIKVYGTNTLSKVRIDAQKAYFFSVYSTSNNPLEVYRGNTYSLLTNALLDNHTIEMYDQELFPDHRTDLDEPTIEKYTAIKRDLETILGINNENEIRKLLEKLKEYYRR